MESAMCLAEAGKLDEAAAAFTALLEACEPENSSHAASLWEMLSQIMMELEDWGAAHEAATKAAALRPKWVDAQVTLARTCRNTGQLPESVAAFAAAAQLAAADGVVDTELAAEAREVEQLYSEQIARQVGLPIHIRSAPGCGLGPGGVVWEAGLLLAHVLVNHLDKGMLSGSRVLELGSGTGLVGLTAAALGAQVTLTDIPDVLPLLTSNAEANEQVVTAAGGSAECVSFTWGQEPVRISPQAGAAVSGPTNALSCQAPVWLLGADLVYSAQQVDQLRQALSWVIAQVKTSSQGQRSELPPAHLQPKTDSSSPALQDWVKRNTHGTKPPCLLFLLAHKHRSPDVDLQLFRMLHDVGLRPSSPLTHLPPEQWGGSGMMLATSNNSSVYGCVLPGACE